MAFSAFSKTSPCRILARKSSKLIQKQGAQANGKTSSTPPSWLMEGVRTLLRNCLQSLVA
jgi:hypothetical protein